MSPTSSHPKLASPLGSNFLTVRPKKLMVLVMTLSYQKY